VVQPRPATGGQWQSLAHVGVITWLVLLRSLIEDSFTSFVSAPTTTTTL